MTKVDKGMAGGPVIILARWVILEPVQSRPMNISQELLAIYTRCYTE